MIRLIAFVLVTAATPALAQGYQSPYDPPQQHYNGAPGLDAPGLYIPGVRDQPPSYGARPDYYNPVPTAPAYVPVTPYSPPATYDPYRPSSPYGQGRYNSGDDD
jgi:hypothetical protein